MIKGQTNKFIADSNRKPYPPRIGVQYTQNVLKVRMEKDITCPWPKAPAVPSARCASSTMAPVVLPGGSGPLM